MEVFSILYDLIFNILLSLGLPIAVTSGLASISLVAIGAGLLLVAPQIFILVVILSFVGQLWR